jgi:hypothetical protein
MDATATTLIDLGSLPDVKLPAFFAEVTATVFDGAKVSVRAASKGPRRRHDACGLTPVRASIAAADDEAVTKATRRLQRLVCNAASRPFTDLPAVPAKVKAVKPKLKPFVFGREWLDAQPIPGPLMFVDGAWLWSKRQEVFPER